ncbi:MAG: PQQ-dependent dehydrogenase, methanol/ethanol family [Steroidobacteraceae bacterium]
MSAWLGLMRADKPNTDRKGSHSARTVLIGLSLLAAGCSGGGSDSGSASKAPDANAGNVTLPRLLAADKESGNWFTAGRDFGKGHYSPLTGINQNNVATLGLAWEYQTNTKRGLEATPIVVDGVMYTSGVAGRVYALNAATGAELWSFDPQINMMANRFACCDAVNRGVAVWQGKVYVAALDGKLFALNAATGAVIWSANTFVDNGHSYASTGAPEVAGKVVVIGNSGAELDARGYVSAYDLNTGELKWRFYTVPGDPKKGFEHPELEAAAKTWDPNSRWEIGGGGTPWDGMVYDPELNLLYVGTGNGAPHSYHVRSPKGGENLYLTSILAINPDTGRMKWYLQEAPGDAWDYTATAPMILSDLNLNGSVRKVLMQAPKNGFFYVIDRATGELLSANPYVPVNWAEKIDLKTGKATVNRKLADYSTGTKLVFPSGQGGHNWNPMSYSPATGLVYIPAIEVGEYLYQPPGQYAYRPRARNHAVASVFSGLAEEALPNLPPEMQKAIRSGELKKGQPDTHMRALLKAWDPVAGRTMWEVESDGGYWDRAGVLSTASNLVFQGTGTGKFRVYDATNGKLLKDIDVGTTIVAAPMTYTVNGEQYVAVMAAWGGAGWYRHPPESAAAQFGNAGRILAFKLGGGAVPHPSPLPALSPIPEPPALTADDATVQRGRGLFTAYCIYCHVNSDRTGSADLRRMSSAVHSTFKDILLRGQRLPLGMPRFDDVLSETDADAIHAYLISSQWQAYQNQQQGSTGPSGEASVAR